MALLISLNAPLACTGTKDEAPSGDEALPNDSAPSTADTATGSADTAATSGASTGPSDGTGTSGTGTSGGTGPSDGTGPSGTGASSTGTSDGASDVDMGQESEHPPDAGAPPPPAYERVGCDLPFVMSYCGGATCHYDTASQEVGSSLALWHRETESLLEDVETRLVNVPATYHNVQNSEDCPSEPELLIDPTDVEQSLVLKKLLGTHTCGDEMPRFPYPEWGTVSVPGPQREQLVDCVREWLELVAADYNADR